MIVPETYPFDPYFGSKLKYQIQTRDTNLRKTFIATEINNIVKVVSLTVGADVVVEGIQLVPNSTNGGTGTEYNASILLKINNDQTKKLNLTFIGPS